MSKTQMAIRKKKCSTDEFWQIPWFSSLQLQGTTFMRIGHKWQNGVSVSYFYITLIFQ